jgi:hypothetical protein
MDVPQSRVGDMDKSHLRAFKASAVAAVCAAAPALAADIDTLRGQFAFDWHSDLAKATCQMVDDKLLSLFKSDAYQCELNPASNTASGEAARVCTQKGDGAEYLIFATQKACEEERKAQEENSE